MRETPICRSRMAADLAAGQYSVTQSIEHIKCIGSMCSMWHARNDNTPTQDLGCCAENKTAVPWADPAAEESK